MLLKQPEHQTQNIRRGLSMVRTKTDPVPNDKKYAQIPDHVLHTDNAAVMKGPGARSILQGITTIRLPEDINI